MERKNRLKRKDLFKCGQNSKNFYISLTFEPIQYAHYNILLKSYEKNNHSY